MLLPLHIFKVLSYICSNMITSRSLTHPSDNVVSAIWLEGGIQVVNQTGYLLSKKLLEFLLRDTFDTFSAPGLSRYSENFQLKK